MFNGLFLFYQCYIFSNTLHFLLKKGPKVQLTVLFIIEFVMVCNLFDTRLVTLLIPSAMLCFKTSVSVHLPTHSSNRLFR